MYKISKIRWEKIKNEKILRIIDILAKIWKDRTVLKHRVKFVCFLPLEKQNSQEASDRTEHIVEICEKEAKMSEEKNVVNQQGESQELKRGIKGWQVAFIGLGGVIGSCYFLGLGLCRCV